MSAGDSRCFLAVETSRAAASLSFRCIWTLNIFLRQRGVLASWSFFDQRSGSVAHSAAYRHPDWLHSKSSCQSLLHWKPSFTVLIAQAVSGTCTTRHTHDRHTHCQSRTIRHTHYQAHALQARTISHAVSGTRGIRHMHNRHNDV